MSAGTADEESEETPVELAATDGDWGASAMMVEAPAPEVLVDADARPMITNGASADPMIANGANAVPMITNGADAVPMIAVGIDAVPL
ncbi:MAG: hypothetical protein U0414_04220 [Polyangiaceae bacterium]